MKEEDRIATGDVKKTEQVKKERAKITCSTFAASCHHHGR